MRLRQPVASEIAAELVGASDALFYETVLINIPYMKTLYQQTIDRLRSGVSKGRVTAWIERGSLLTYEEAIAVARNLQ